MQQPHDTPLKLVADPHAHQGLSAIAPPVASVMVVIGAEGGLSVDEIQQLQHVGFETVCLGRRILRAETAGVVVVSALQTLFGDMN